MKKLNANHLKILYRFCMALAVISLIGFIALTWRREIQFPSIAAFLPLFVIAVVLVSKKVKKEATSSKEELNK
jgi:hypothetical protein